MAMALTAAAPAILSQMEKVQGAASGTILQGTYQPFIELRGKDRKAAIKAGKPWVIPDPRFPGGVHWQLPAWLFFLLISIGGIALVIEFTTIFGDMWKKVGWSGNWWDFAAGAGLWGLKATEQGVKMVEEGAVALANTAVGAVESTEHGVAQFLGLEKKPEAPKRKAFTGTLGKLSGLTLELLGDGRVLDMKTGYATVELAKADLPTLKGKKKGDHWQVIDDTGAKVDGGKF